MVPGTGVSPRDTSAKHRCKFGIPHFVLSPVIMSYCIVLLITASAIVLRKRKTRIVGLLQGVALQMAAVVPVAVAQLTGFVWKSWSVDPAEAIEVFPVSVLYGMAGWSMYSTFEWLVPMRLTWL